jgi:hypothetical protein
MELLARFLSPLQHLMLSLSEASIHEVLLWGRLAQHHSPSAGKGPQKPRAGLRLFDHLDAYMQDERFPEAQVVKQLGNISLIADA